MKSFLQQELIRQGVLWGGFHNLSAAHTDDDVSYLLKVYQEAMAALKQVVERGTLVASLRGTPVEPTFRQTTNFNLRPKPPAQEANQISTREPNQEPTGANL